MLYAAIFPSTGSVTHQPQSTPLHTAPIGLTPAQEVAVLYANGREKDAEALLRREMTQPDTDSALWLLLFDLLRVQGEWARFEDLGKQFQARFAKPAPQWLSDEELARLPPELRPGGAGYFVLGALLDGGHRTEIERIRAAARDFANVHIDVSRTAGVDEKGCRLFAALLESLPDQGTGVLLTGTDHLAELVQGAAEGNPGVESYWKLLLEMYRVQGAQKAFQRTALEFALAAGVEPPEWQPVLMPLAPRSAPQEKRDAPRYQAGPEVIYLTGVMWGAGDAQLSELEEFAADRRYVNINLSTLRRIESTCGNAFANLVNDLVADNKVVRLIRPNALVAGFLASLNLAPGVSIVSSR
jgi:ABC-type transporter Mla MlaB component